MATTTLNLACIGSAYADYNQQSTNFSTAQEYDLPYASSTGGESRLYLKFESFPRAYHRRILEDAYVTEYWRATYNTRLLVSANFRACGDFNESTLTYANAPGQTASIGYNSFSSMSGHVTPNPTVLPENLSSGSTAPKNAKAILQHSCVYINRQAGSGYSSTHLYLKTRRASTKPVLTVKFGDQIVAYKCKGLTKTSGFVNRFIDNRFTWSIVKTVSGDYCVADPVQVSAVFHWRLGTSGSFNEIEIPDGSQEVTVPAGTFPGGSIQWYVTAKDDYNIDLQEDAVYTISTLVGDLTAKPSSPINGAFCDPAGTGTFMWSNTNAHDITTQMGADLQYSTDGTTWTDLGSVTGTAQSYTVPAGVFTQATTYYWRVRAYNVDNEAGPWSDAASFSTVDSTMYATPLHPVSEIRDYTAPIMFEWEYSSDTGTIPQQTDLQTSINGTDWTTRAQTGVGVLRYTVAANTFAAGAVYWRVRSYNSNNVAGPWSSAAAFVAYGAPPQPSVSVDAVPFAVIRWQSSGQIAYKVTVDGMEYGPFFGTAKSYALQDYLADGEHTASVTIQGAYGLWSPAGSVVFTVENVPGEEPLTISGKFKDVASLSLFTQSEIRDFLIYRDGVQIGHTPELSFDDRVVLGAHTWRAVNRLADGNYTESNTVQGTLRVCALTIVPLSGGDPVVLKKSEDEYAEISYTKTQTVSLRQFTGEDYPRAEISPYLNLRASFDVAWTYAERDEAARFEAMIGKTVIFKAQDGEAFVGVMSAWNRGSKKFFRSYTATVQRTHWRDYVDADD